MTNCERLVAAGLLEDATLTEEQRTAIENLTTEEVDSLISIDDRLKALLPEEQYCGQHERSASRIRKN
jgi:hypothetical protein